MYAHDLARKLLEMPNVEVTAGNNNAELKDVLDVDVHRTPYDGDVIRLTLTERD